MTRRQRSRRHVCRKRRIIAPDGNPVKVATHGIGRFSEDVELREVVGDDDFLWAHAPAFHADANAVIDVCAARGWELRYELDHSEEVTSYVAWVETDEMRPDRYGRLTNEYDGLKQRNQVVAHLHSTQGNDYGFVIAWDNQSLDLNDTGIYQQLIGYKHNLLNLEDGNSNFIFTHYNQLGIGTTTPDSSLHIKTRLSNGTNSNNAIGDPPNTSTIHLQNTSTHVITNEDLQSIKFSDGSNNVLNKIQSVNSLRYDGNFIN